jgi:hypothetical protein
MNHGKCIFCGVQTTGREMEVGGAKLSFPAPEVCIAQSCIDKATIIDRENRMRDLIPKLLGEVPQAIRETDLAMLPSDKARSIADQWIPNPKGKHLFVCGGVRSGKTRSAFLVARRLSILSESPIKWVDSFRLEEAFTGYGAGNADLTRLRTSRLILLDDLGKEKLTDKVASGIFKIIDHRTSHGLTTIITSNFTPTALADRFADETLGGAIRGRLIDFFDRYLLEKVNP